MPFARCTMGIGYRRIDLPLQFPCRERSSWMQAGRCFCARQPFLERYSIFPGCHLQFNHWGNCRFKIWIVIDITTVSAPRARRPQLSLGTKNACRRKLKQNKNKREINYGLARRQKAFAGIVAPSSTESRFILFCPRFIKMKNGTSFACV